jgi:hypothetical protein
MSKSYYKEACMCRNPMPSRIIPQRCAWCGGILPPSVRAMYAIEQELDSIPTGGAILAVVVLAIALMVMVAIGRITLIASQHHPNPPVGAVESPAPEAVATGD